MAEVIKVDIGVLQRLEAGKAEPGVVLVADLVRVLKLDIMAVVYGQRSSKLQSPAEETE